VSSTLDDHIRAVLDRLRVTLSGQLESELAASTDDIARAVTDEHRQAIIEVTARTAAETRLEAEQQLSAARSEFERQREDLERDNGGLQHENRDLRQEKEDLEREKEDLQREKEDIRQGAASEIAGFERALSEVRDELEATRRTLDEVQNVREALRSQLEQSRHDHESSMRQLQDGIERASRDTEQTRLEADASARELEGMHAKLAQTTRLTSALRTLDEATSLGDILNRLAQSACQESGRTAVFLVNGNKLRGWRAVGFGDGDPIVGSDFEPGEAGVVGQAVRLGSSQQHRNGDSAQLPSFASADDPRDAIALPVQVGGSVIAVLYADAARTDRPEDPEWLDTIDAMTKHAGRALEAMTVRQAAALWTPRQGARR
jgi:hypothetical protein